MPKVGEIKTLQELGYKGYPTNKCIWSACIDCGKERWVQLVQGKPVSSRCQRCGSVKWGVNNPNWKGGIYKKYAARIHLKMTNHYRPMANKDGNIYLHRFIMARHRGRLLLPSEIVHHKNGNKLDNRIENLELLPSGAVHNSKRSLRSQVAQLHEEKEALVIEVYSLRKEREGLMIT